MSKLPKETEQTESWPRKIFRKVSGKTLIKMIIGIAALLLIVMATVAITTVPESSSTAQKTKLSEYTNGDLAVYLEGKTPLNVSAWIDGNKVNLDYDAETSLDENDAVFRFAKNAESLMPTIFKIKGVENVYMQESGQITDDYGNSKKEIILGMGIRKSTADKTDWAKINSSNRAGIFAIADDIYIHPAFEKKLTGDEIKEALEKQKTIRLNH